VPWYTILPGYWDLLEFLDGFGGKEDMGMSVMSIMVLRRLGR